MTEEYDPFGLVRNGYSTPKKGLNDDLLVDFARLRVSALTNAAEISPMVKEVTIGPNSPYKKDQCEAIIINKISDEKSTKKHIVKDDPGANDLQFTAAVKMYESTLHDSSESIFKNLIYKMVAKRAEYMKKYWTKQSEICERRALEMKVRKQHMLKELQDNDNLTVTKKAMYDEQNMKTIESMNKILEEQNRAATRFASITDSHTKVCLCYNEISSLFENDEYAKRLSNKYITAINTVINNMTKVMDICKSGDITDAEVKQAEILSNNIENIRKDIFDECNQLRQHELIQKQQTEAKKKEEELKRIEDEQKQQAARAEQQKQAAEKSKGQPLFYSARNYRRYEELHNFLLRYESLYKDLQVDTNMKKYRFDCQKAVNTPLNAISSVSGIHIRDKYEKLFKLMRGERVQVLDTYVTASQHPQGLPYCIALLAKKIVRQGDLLVSSNPEAAFPLAAVTVALCSQFTEFSQLLEANFHRECPYLVPMFLPQKEGMTDKEFYMSRGYRYSEEGVVEKQDKFLKRMSGIFRLKCAIWIAKTPRFMNASNPCGLGQGWQWLASFINLKPEPDLSATLLYDFFTVCGSEFYQHYGIQFVKIIKLISTDYLGILENIDTGGPKSRLEVLLQKILTTGHISAPTGLLPDNSW